MKLVHLELAEANDFVETLHRHHRRVAGHRFSVGCVDANGRLVGVAIVGRPVARQVNFKEVLEVTRLCTDGTKNACSFLYAACARAGRELGYKKIQTYILTSENGVTLRASGWRLVDEKAGGGEWKRSDGQPRNNTHPTETKQRWEKVLQ